MVFFFLFTNLNLVRDNNLTRNQFHHSVEAYSLGVSHFDTVVFAFKVVSALAVHLEEVVEVFASSHKLK